MIQSLTVENFRSLAAANVPLTSPVTLVLGPNGAGKSSLAGALRWALTGACDWTDGAGKGAALLIRHGRKSANVDVVLDRGETLSRGVTASGGALAFGDYSGKEAQVALEALLPNRDLLDCCLDSLRFVDAPAKEQQDLLFGLAGGEVDGEWVRGHLTPEQAELVAGELAMRLRGAALMERLHAAAYAMRTQANKRAKDLKARATVDAPAGVTGRAPENIEAELRNARQGVETVQQRLGAAQERNREHSAALLACETTDRRLKDLRARREQLGAEPALPEGDVTKAEAALAAAQGKVHEAITAAEAASAAAAEVKRQLEQFRELQGCVAGNVQCPLSAEDRARALADMEQRLQDLRAKRDRHTDAAHGHEREMTAAEKRVAELRNARAEHDRWEAAGKQLEAALSEAELAAGNALTNYQRIGAIDTEALEKARQEAAGIIGDLEHELAMRRQAEAAAKEQAQLRADLAEAEAEAADLDALVKLLSPDGLPAQAMRETIGAVMTQVNEVLAAFSDFTLSAEPGKEFRLLVTRGGETTPVSHLSESERLRVGVAIQVAIARLIGWHLVVVDEADRLDGPNRSALLRMLLRSGIKTLVLATPANGQRPKAPGLAVYEIEGGAAQAVAA